MTRLCAMTHRIRLGPPWQVTSVGDRTRHVRRFGQPRTLEANEQVWLVCEPVAGPAELFVNGERIGAMQPAEPFAADITPLMKTRNEVVFDAASDAPLGAVALVIRAV